MPLNCHIPTQYRNFNRTVIIALRLPYRLYVVGRAGGGGGGGVVAFVHMMRNRSIGSQNNQMYGSIQNSYNHVRNSILRK